VIVPPDLLSVVLDALADRIAARIGSTRERETYSSCDLPPRTSRRRFAELCRSGRVADARRHGRDWSCSREAWEGARTRRAPQTTRDRPVLPVALRDRADALLSRAGLRVVLGGS
jgi:hypothetical protein